MCEENPKEEATRRQGEAQEEHALSAPDSHMEAEGMAARRNPEAGARDTGTS